MARIAVLEFGQDPDSQPEHFVSKPIAARMVQYFHNGKRAAVKLTDRVIRIMVPVAFGKLKALLKGRGLMNGVEKRQSWRECLLIHYPIADQRSNAVLS